MGTATFQRLNLWQIFEIYFRGGKSLFADVERGPGAGACLTNRMTSHRGRAGDRKAYPRGDPKLKHWATSPDLVGGERPKAEALGT